MNNLKVFVSKSTGKAYQGRNTGINLNETIPNFNINDYVKTGENALFYIFELKKSTT